MLPGRHRVRLRAFSCHRRMVPSGPQARNRASRTAAAELRRRRSPPTSPWWTWWPSPPRRRTLLPLLRNRISLFCDRGAGSRRGAFAPCPLPPRFGTRWRIFRRPNPSFHACISDVGRPKPRSGPVYIRRPSLVRIRSRGIPARWTSFPFGQALDLVATASPWWSWRQRRGGVRQVVTKLPRHRGAPGRPRCGAAPGPLRASSGVKTLRPVKIRRVLRRFKAPVSVRAISGHRGAGLPQRLRPGRGRSPVLD